MSWAHLRWEILLMELARNSGWRNCPDFTVLFQHQLTPWLWSWKLPFVLSQSLHGHRVLNSKWEGSWLSYSGKQQHVEAQDSRKQSCQDLCHHFLWPHHCCIIAFHSWRPGWFGFQFQVCHLERGVGNKKRTKSVPQDSVDHFYRTKRVIYLSHCFSCSQITTRWLPFLLILMLWVQASFFKQCFPLNPQKDMAMQHPLHFHRISNLGDALTGFFRLLTVHK